MKSDFRTCEFENVPMGDSVAFMMVKSNAKHALVDGAYASRRQACEDAAKYFAGVLKHPVTHLRDVTCAEWVLYRGGLPETTAKRAIHPIGEDERVLLGAQLLEKGDVAGFGSLMFDSHESIGGSCCLLVRPEAADKIAAQITQAYKTAYGDEPTCAVIKPSAGAHVVNE